MLLAMAVAVSKQMKNCVLQLIDKGRIVTRPDKNAPDYAEALSEFLQSSAKKLVIISLLICVPVILADTYNLWPGFITSHVPSSRKPGWDTAFNVMNWDPAVYDSTGFKAYKSDPPSPISNLIFDTIAYIFEGAAFFLALFWVGKFTLFLLAFARLVGGNDPSYQFNPLKHDLELRLGLKPMGRLFDSFLGITLVIVGYAFYHRLYLIGLAENPPQTVTEYVKNLFVTALPLKSGTNPDTFKRLAGLLRSDIWGLNGLDVSACITIFFMTVPIVVVCFLPLWKIRKLVKDRRDEEINKLQEEHDEALRQQNFDRVQLVQYQKQSLEKANIWPNGDAKAKRFLTLISAFAAGAIAPPLFAIVLAISFSENLTKYFKLIFAPARHP